MTSDDIRKIISRFTLRLQNQAEVPLWALLQEDVIYAAAMNETAIWGPKGNIVFRLMRLGQKCHLTDILLFCIGFKKMFSFWRKVKKQKVGNKKNCPKRVFVGFNAASEEFFYEQYTKQSTLPSARINIITGSGLCEIACPNLFQLILELVKLSYRHTKKLRNGIHEIASNLNEFLTISALNISDYAFYRVFWRMAKLHGVIEADFLAPNIAAIACVDEKINTVYTQHGLMILTVPVPKIDQINVITSFDEPSEFSRVISLIIISSCSLDHFFR